MEGKEKVRRTLLQFNQELSEKVAPAFIKSYECEMKCYENFTQLENADDCAELCRKETNFIRGKLQTEYQVTFVIVT